MKINKQISSKSPLKRTGTIRFPAMDATPQKKIPKEMKILNVDEIIKQGRIKTKFDEVQRERGDFLKFIEQL